MKRVTFRSLVSGVVALLISSLLAVVPNRAVANELVIGYIPAATFEGNDGLPFGTAVMGSMLPSNNPGPTDDADGAGGDAAVPFGSLAPGVNPPDVHPVAGGGLGGEWTCTVYASDPYHGVENGTQVIEGSGFHSCWGVGWEFQKLRIRVQQYRGAGYWRTKYDWNSGWKMSDFVSRNVWWYCAPGSGTQTYRIVSTGYADSGAQSLSVQSENYLRVKCPI